MSLRRKGILFSALLLTLPLLAWPAAVIISMERTTMPRDEWTRMTDGIAQYEAMLQGLAPDEEATISVKGEAIQFIFRFADGWDYHFYQTWKDYNIEALNQAIREGSDPGFKWTLTVEGEISAQTNPWREVNWLPAVQVIDGAYLKTDSIGWLWSDTWKPEGNFWAYAYSIPAMTWLYVFGGGYYYSAENSLWYYNWPGSGWFFEYQGTGTGQWLMLAAQTLPSIAAIDDIVIDEMIKQNIPGIAVGVFENGQLVHVKGYGNTNIESASAVTTSTIFRWASISKPLTAVAALQLHESDIDFRITDNVTKHTPYWTSSTTNDASQITITHLLSNRSGIHHYGNGRDDDGDGDPDNTYTWDSSVYNAPDPSGYNAQEAVAVFSGTGIDFTPGSEYLYTTFGFNLLGSAIDEASPNGYVDWIEDNIADPLGMSSLQVATGNRRGYQRSCDGRLNERILDSQEWKLPGGGWESNIVDLTRFARAVADESLLDVGTRLWTNVAGNDTYRYGVNADGLEFGDFFRVWHGGAHANLRTLMHVFPNRDYGVVVMAFAEWADAWRLIRRIDGEYGIVYDNIDTSPVDACLGVMGSCNGRFSGVWRDTGKDVIIRRGYSHSAFLREWQFLRDNGYYCDDFEAYVEDGQLRWDGVFREGPGGNPMWRNFTFDDFYDKWVEQSALGYRLVDLETYVVNGQRLWAGLWRPGSGPYAMWRGLSTADFGAKREEMAAQGLKLIDIEAFVEEGELLWAGAWISGQDGLLNRNYSTEDFGELRQSRRAAGWKLIDIEVYEVNGERLWAGIWEQSPQEETLFRLWNYCDFMDHHENASSMGFELIDFERL